MDRLVDGLDLERGAGLGQVEYDAAHWETDSTPPAL